jgi:hypothetical protein
MSNSFASGRKAFGFCERCNFRFSLTVLRPESVRGKLQYNRVCPQCFDKDHPQNFLGMYPVHDPQALRRPAPDPSLAASREIPDNGQSIEDLFI